MLKTNEKEKFKYSRAELLEMDCSSTLTCTSILHKLLSILPALHLGKKHPKIPFLLQMQGLPPQSQISSCHPCLILQTLLATPGSSKWSCTEGELSIEINLQHKMPALQFYGLKLLNHRDLLFAVRRKGWGGWFSWFGLFKFYWWCLLSNIKCKTMLLNIKGVSIISGS